jgi:DNA-binding transcriptional ArsR family regulator
MTVGQIAEQFDKLTYSAVSKQLSILKKAGLVDSQQIGTFVVYEINTTIFDDILAWVKGLREEVKGEVVKESRFDIVIRSRA